MSTIFYCYSPRMKDFLKSMGFIYLEKGVNPNSGSTFYTFKKSPELDVAIEKWNKLKSL